MTERIWLKMDHPCYINFNVYVLKINRVKILSVKLNPIIKSEMRISHLMLFLKYQAETIFPLHVPQIHTHNTHKISHRIAETRRKAVWFIFKDEISLLYRRE